MQTKNKIDVRTPQGFSDLISKIKNCEDLKTDRQLAEFLGVKESTIAMAKQRGFKSTLLSNLVNYLGDSYAI